MVAFLKSVLKSIPPFSRVVAERDRLQLESRRLAEELQRVTAFAAPGHFYSPIPSESDIRRRESAVAPVADVELNANDQRELLTQFARYYADLPFSPEKTAARRFYFNQRYYRHSDAIYLYAMLRHFRPQRYIEVGSGFSSAAALDTSELFLESSVNFTFIEPYPDRLRGLLKTEDWRQCRLLEQPVQDVDLSYFESLQVNDFLFIDSSHVCKVGSDVNHLIFHILPRLRPGVLIHIHDIFYPYEYPEEWLREGRAWNEAYVVRAFLQNNRAYRILLFASYVGRQFKDLLAEEMPLCLQDTGGALWLRKE